MNYSSLVNYRRSSAKREPLYTMEEISEKLGISRQQIVALGKHYGHMAHEFERNNNSGTGQSRKFKMSVAKAWWAGLPEESRKKALEKRSAKQQSG